MTAERPHILIVDDDPLIRASLYEVLRKEGHPVQMAADGSEALRRFQAAPTPIVITDLKMPGMDGVQLLQSLKRLAPDIAVVLITGFGTVETAVEAMKLGAYDYVTKPLADGEIQHVVRNICHERDLVAENQSLRQQLATSVPDHFQGMVGRHPSMRKIYATIEAIASTKAIVFIRGESGTGKGLVARAIHDCDPGRREQPFIEVSCGALPETMLESELFGHVRGAFTGAIRDRAGRFELAHGGTIFLDEIDTMTPGLQVKLLRVLQSGQFERVGDTKTNQTDARIIAAMNRDPEEAMKGGTLREDLYYRLHVIAIFVPPLRDRMDDVPLLVQHFLAKSAERAGRKLPELDPAALQALMTYRWPGNVRELENALERAVVLSKHRTLRADDLPDTILRGERSGGAVVPTNGETASTLRESLEAPERQRILDTLTHSHWNCQRAAEALGVNRATLYNKMKKYGIPPKNRQRGAQPA